MILFAGIPSEEPLRLAIEQADLLELPHIVLNQRQVDRIDLRITMDDAGVGGTLRIGGGDHALDTITGCYARLTDAATLPELRARGRTPPDPARVAHAGALFALFDDLLDLLPARVANRPSATGSNMSKPFQAQLIAAAGLATPPTLVTNDPDAVRAFHADHGRIVYKSVSAVRSIVRPWSPGDTPDLAAVTALPTQFQAFVPGENVRVHVVGGDLFATRIVSDAIDYRYAEREGRSIAMEAVELPRPIHDACVTLTAALGLLASGIDLKRTPDGEWFCFEVNTQPAYSYFEQHGGQPIAATLVRLLAGSD